MNTQKHIHSKILMLPKTCPLFKTNMLLILQISILTTSFMPSNNITFIVYCLLVCLMVLNISFNNISVISWRSSLLVEESGEPGENHGPVSRHWQTLSHNVVHLYLIEIRTRKWTKNIDNHKSVLSYLVYIRNVIFTVLDAKCTHISIHR